MNVYRQPNPRPHLEGRAAVDDVDDADVESSDVAIEVVPRAKGRLNRLTVGTYVAVIMATVVAFLLGYDPH